MEIHMQSVCIESIVCEIFVEKVNKFVKWNILFYCSCCPTEEDQRKFNRAIWQVGEANMNMLRINYNSSVIKDTTHCLLMVFFFTDQQRWRSASCVRSSFLPRSIQNMLSHALKRKTRKLIRWPLHTETSMLTHHF